uniref:DNA mismatch repair proteins mutS family domain-containing protein n=1 Tax=Amphiprion ocellaris TaxID=80972 RepID=A0A3Q1BFM4_AMPOC
MAAALEDLRGGGMGFGPPGLNGDEEEEEDSPAVLLSVVVQHGQVGLCFYDSADSSLHYMVDTPDNHELHLLTRVIQEVSPHVIITSAKQERCMTRYLQELGQNPHYKPEVVTYPYVDFGLEVGKQRLLSANLPFLPSCISDRDRMSYLSSCISFDSPLMLRAVGALLKCLDRRRVGVELEDSSVGVPILQFHAYTLKGVVCIDRDTYSVLQIFKSELHPSVYKLQSGEKEGLSLYGILNRCRCKFGSKLLRLWFLRPTQDLAVLHRRQEVIRFFTSPRNSEVLTTLQSSLRNIRNIPFLSEDRLHYRSQRTRELDDLLGDLHCDIRDMETAVMTQLQSAILERSSSLYKVLDLTAELDCLMAMSTASQEYSYTSPKLANHRKITITQGRHPLLELCSPVFVANSFHSSESEGRVKIITGPNSSGKSIYLKQVGLIVFMALIGSDVPAKEAEIGLVDGIFTRMQSRESVSVGLSTFMIDLNQMAQALNSSTGNSLVLIDEFGKGTNTVDGLSLLAASICHWLRKAPVDVPHVLLATNFHSVLQLGLLPSSSLLSLLTLETAVDGDELVFLYQLKDGICQSSYAANIATLAGLPTCLVQRGVEVSELYRTGRPIKRTEKASSDEQAKRCRSVVEKFLSLDLDDKDLDLQAFMKDELLPSAGELLNRS